MMLIMGYLRAWSCRSVVLLSVATTAGCSLPTYDEKAVDEPEVGQTRLALLGVPEDGYPSYDELLQVVAMNRVRADPNKKPLHVSTG